MYRFGGRWLPGEVDVSSGRIPQGHVHSKAGARPGITQDLRTENYQHALDAGRRIECLASALLYVLHPALYFAGRRCLAQMIKESDEATKEALRKWGNVFAVLDVLVNRESPLHIDKEPAAGWLDILVTLGQYPSCMFQSAMTGQNFDYSPGTVIAINGSRLVHGASRAEGDRACFAFYLRLHMVKYFGVARVGVPPMGARLPSWAR